jgi:hypothetical protein
MSDYEDLFDELSFFKGKKYIIHAYPPSMLSPANTDAFAEEPDLEFLIE